MKILISPAKSLDLNSDFGNFECSIPKFLNKTSEINEVLKETDDDDNPFIIGGGQIYKLAMDFSDKIELTRVHGEFKADTFFPKIDESKWKLIHEELNEKDERHQFSYTYKTYIKIR